MRSHLRSPWGKSAAAIVATALVLLAAGSALAASGVGTLVTRGENGAASAHGAQAPVGSVSATPSVTAKTPNSGVGSDVASHNPIQDADVKTQPGRRKSGVETATANGGAAGSGGAPGGAAGSQLPFTGFLAIPVLLGGAALLLIGSALRRRTPQPV